MNLQHGDTVLLIGDSITDCGRARPVGERGGLGDGYASLVEALLGAAYPERRVRLLNTGISGNRVTDLAARWQTDAIDLKPDWLSVFIGINDVWRQFDSPADPNPVDLVRYETVYREILGRIRPALKGLVLMAPFFLESNRQDPMRAKMDAYGAVVRKLAGEFKAVFVDVPAAFDAHLAHRATQTLCGDRVHPNRTGHLIIASALLTALGFDWGRLAAAKH